MVNLRILVSYFILALVLQLDIDCGIQRILLRLSIIVEIGHLIHHILTEWFSRPVTDESMVEKFCGFLFCVAFGRLHFENILL